jgi:hypothetical protein
MVHLGNEAYKVTALHPSSTTAGLACTLAGRVGCGGRRGRAWGSPMPKRPSKGLKSVTFELDPGLVERLRLRAEQQQRTFRNELERAILRHLAHPEPDREPDPPIAPLPPVAPVAKPRNKGRGK